MVCAAPSEATIWRRRISLAENRLAEIWRLKQSKKLGGKCAKNQAKAAEKLSQNVHLILRWPKFSHKLLMDLKLDEKITDRSFILKNDQKNVFLEADP